MWRERRHIGILLSEKNSAKLSEHPWGSTAWTAPICSLGSKEIELQDCYFALLAVLSVFYCLINNMFLFFLLFYPPFSLLLNPPLLNPPTNIQYFEMASSILPKGWNSTIWIKMRKNNMDSIFSGWVTALIHHAGYSGKWWPRTPGDHLISF